MMVSPTVQIDLFAQESPVSKSSSDRELTSGKGYFEALNNIVDESVFPDSYPQFLKQVYIFFRQTEYLEQLTRYDREILLKSQEKELINFLHKMLAPSWPRAGPTITTMRPNSCSTISSNGWIWNRRLSTMPPITMPKI